jgi:hypothetical protein
MEEAAEDIFRSEILFKLNATTSRSRRRTLAGLDTVHPETGWHPR